MMQVWLSVVASVLCLRACCLWFQRQGSCANFPCVHRVPVAEHDEPQVGNHLFHPGNPSVASRQLRSIKELHDSKDGGNGAANHCDEENPFHVAQTKRFDAPSSLPCTSTSSPFLLPPFGLQPVEAPVLLQLQDTGI